jgi:hypothetical protein
VTEMAVHTVVLSLAWFAAVNAMGSMVATVLALIVQRFDPTTRRPQLFLAIRLLPSALSLLFVSVMFFPSQWLLEPRDTTETLGLAWYALAGAGAWLLSSGLSRAVAIGRVSRQARLGGRQFTVGTENVHEVELPGVSLAGVLKPQILVGRAVTAGLSSAELEVAVAHETAHRDAFDNLARWAMLCAPDFLRGSVIAMRLEEGWHAAAESRADARAIDGNKARAVHLASALLKVARLSAKWTQQFPAPSWSALNDCDLLEWRVHRLLDGALPEAEPGARRASHAALVLVALMVAVPLLAEPLHRVTEALVAWLP